MWTADAPICMLRCHGDRYGASLTPCSQRWKGWACCRTMVAGGWTPPRTPSAAAAPPLDAWRRTTCERAHAWHLHIADRHVDMGADGGHHVQLGVWWGSGVSPNLCAVGIRTYKHVAALTAANEHVANDVSNRSSSHSAREYIAAALSAWHPQGNHLTGRERACVAMRRCQGCAHAGLPRRSELVLVTTLDLKLTKEVSGLPRHHANGTASHLTFVGILGASTIHIVMQEQ